MKTKHHQTPTIETRKHPTHQSHHWWTGAFFSRDLGSHQVVSCRQEKEDRSHSNELGVWLGDVFGGNQRVASRWYWFIRIYLEDWKRTKSWHGWMAVLISNLSLPFVKIWNHHSNDSWTRFLVKYMVLVTSKELFVFPMPPRHCQ